MFNKKKELTRVEASTLSLTQWSIRELLPQEFKNKQVYFTQVEISKRSTSEIGQMFKTHLDREYKAMALKTYFSIEGYSNNSKATRITATFLFHKIFEGHFEDRKDKNVMVNSSRWEMSAFSVMVVDFPMQLGNVQEGDIFPGLPSIKYDSLLPSVKQFEQDRKIEKILKEIFL